MFTRELLQALFFLIAVRGFDVKLTRYQPGGWLVVKVNGGALITKPCMTDMERRIPGGVQSNFPPGGLAGCPAAWIG